jgi:hypothetical protein
MAQTATAASLERLEKWLPAALALLLALVSVRPYAGCWNDGSRLATVESLIERHTFAIDDSVFVRVPSQLSPYGEGPLLARQGTLDKMRIDGHFYSDKSPVPAVLMALCYAVWRALTGLTAAARPDLFCYVLSLLWSGLPYVVAVVSLDQIGRVLRLPAGRRWLLTLSFALATVAPAYVRHVNNHILFMGVAMPLMWQAALLAKGRSGWKRLILLGLLAGFGYTIDLGVGPALLLCLLPLVAWRRPGILPVATVLLAALPWLAAHHALNYWVGGTWRPANANPEYFDWPGSPFPPQSLTGAWNHQNVGSLAVYALALLFGKHGFFGHNLPLFLLIAALPVFWRLRRRAGPELSFVASWCGLSWALYAWASTNYAGQCLSVRWFVPLLAPAYYALAVLLRHSSRAAGELIVWSAWGAVLAGLAWWSGPWPRHMVPGFWTLNAGALTCWIAYRLLRRRSAAGPTCPWKMRRIFHEAHPASPVPVGGAGD